MKNMRLPSAAIFLLPATKLGQGNIFRSMCQEFCPQGQCAWWGGHVWQGGHAWQGACMAGGHAWQGGMHGRGACMAGRACMAGGHAWQGGHVCQGVCMAGGMHGRGVHGRYYEIWSMSGQYASYWNAFFFMTYFYRFHRVHFIGDA